MFAESDHMVEVVCPETKEKLVVTKNPFQIIHYLTLKDGTEILLQTLNANNSLIKENQDVDFLEEVEFNDITEKISTGF
jgi:hypothetical protein